MDGLISTIEYEGLLRMQGTNGVEYYGTYFVSSGTYARIRRAGMKRKA